MRHSEYIAYLRTLAEKHKDIGHSPTRNHFIRIVLSDDVLGQIDLEELISAESSSLHVPFLVASAAENMYEDNKSDNLKKHFAGMFWLLTKPESELYDHQEAAYDQMELLAEQVLARIREDFAGLIDGPSQGAKRYYSVSETTVSKVNIGEYMGVRVNLQFFTTANQALAYDATKWNP